MTWLVSDRALEIHQEELTLWRFLVNEGKDNSREQVELGDREVVYVKGECRGEEVEVDWGVVVGMAAGRAWGIMGVLLGIFAVL